MKLNKEKWERTTLDNCCDFYRGVVFSKKDEVDKNGYAILRSHNVDFEESKISLHNLKYVSTEIKVKEEQRLKKNDILISVANSKEQTGKVGFSWDDTNTYAGGFMAILTPKYKIEPFYLFLYLLTNKSKDFIAGRTQGTTNIFNITFERIKDLPIPLPPLSEQKQIAALFQSIDTAMEQVEKQEEKLKELRKNLINKLNKKNPQFGKAIKPESCKEYSIGDIATERKDRTDNPSTSGFDKFIGLEDFETGELFIQKFSSTKKLVSAMRLCKKGDVLFARRNAYLKRASLTKFDAVCSGDVIVMEVNPKIILPEFLILVMNTDAFWDFAIANAAGTMSKRVKWRDLATYSFDLPDIETQAKILKVFNQLEGALTQLKNHKETLKLLKQKLLNEILG